ncbi:MAG: DUF177 domain-containing protein [Chitinophagales bacterium]|nr:DUF177 domain-containing protein [Chitinophagales bacterium]
MQKLEHFSLPFLGMKDGIHTYDFEVGDDFFKEFSHSPIEKGQFTVQVVFDKQPGISEMDLHIDGFVKAVCDRCLSDIDLPVTGHYHLYVKQSNEEIEEDEMIFIKEGVSRLFLAQVIYEYIQLSLPLNNIFDCENSDPRPCDDTVLQKLKLSEQEEESSGNDIWNNLKGFISEN